MLGSGPGPGEGEGEEREEMDGERRLEWLGRRVVGERGLGEVGMESEDEPAR